MNYTPILLAVTRWLERNFTALHVGALRLRVGEAIARANKATQAKEFARKAVEEAKAMLKEAAADEQVAYRASLNIRVAAQAEVDSISTGTRV